MMIKKLKKNKGFVILYAVTLSAILLSIALGVAQIALKEIKFSASAKDTDEAFFAADTGAECALFYDKIEPAKNAFTGTATGMTCIGSSITLVPSGNPTAGFWSFTVTNLGNLGQGCAIVTVDKNIPPNTKLISKGYNTAGSGCNPGPNSVEREIELNY